ncbi:acyl-CoA dehydrogenase [Micromonospora sp. DT233]|uniref:acyl-CoA dehydrogenase n=1 Tax=Micromonospora sp. DT233 TaxID=3393432 RepID=UPI003CF36508
MTAPYAPERDLERLLGDPFDEANPLGFGPLLAADERAELLAAGESALERWGCNGWFVPRALGGRWAETDAVGRALRPVFRRDGALGLGYGVTSLMAAVPVWVAGDAGQRRRAADDLLAGHRLAVAFHELAHGNDLLRNELRARPAGDRWVLDGTKEVINNVDRARSVLLFARTRDAAGPRSHSILAADLADLPAAAVRQLPRYASSGVRGCRLGGIELTGCPVPAGNLIGAEGTGGETALRAFQLTRVLLPSMALGVLDAALHVTARFAAGRRLYGHRVADLPHARGTLAAAFVDLLVADCLVTAVARGLHLAPRHAAAPAAATKYLVPRLLGEAMDELSVLLGASFYLREGPYAAFGKFHRDLPALGVGHAGPTACLLTVVPQLPLLARRAWRGVPAPPELFDPTAPLPDLDLTALSVAGTGRDVLISALLAAAEDPPHDAPGVTARIRGLAAEVRRLARDCAALPPAERGPLAGPATFDLAHRYALLLAAAACVGTWRARRGDPAAGLLAGDEWIEAALARLAARCGGDPVLPEAVAEPLFAELSRRVDGRLSCDLRPIPIFG